MPQTKLTGERSSAIEDYIIDHLRLKHIRLVWTWDYIAQYEEQGYVWEDCGEILDAEYTFCGNPKEALQFLAKYDCWNFLEYESICAHKNGDTLEYVHTESSEPSGNLYRIYRPNPESVYYSNRRILRRTDEPETDEERQFTIRWNN